MAASRADQQQLLGSEDTGLQEHNDENCLYCVVCKTLGVNAQTPTQSRSGEPSPLAMKYRPVGVTWHEIARHDGKSFLFCRIRRRAVLRVVQPAHAQPPGGRSTLQVLWRVRVQRRRVAGVRRQHPQHGAGPG